MPGVYVRARRYRVRDVASAAQRVGRAVTPDLLMRLLRPSEAALSRDGRQIAFAVTESFSEPNERPRSRIWLGAVDGEPRQVTHGPGVDMLPRFSPDGRLLAFASDREQPGLMSLYLLATGGEGEDEAQPLGRLEGSVEDIQWAAGGGSLVVLAADPGSDRAGAQQATRIVAKDGADDDPDIRRPFRAWRRLLRVDTASGEAAEVGTEGVNVWEFDLRDEGSAVAVVSDDPSESSWYDAYVALLDLDARTARNLYRPRWQLQALCSSPDGRRVAFVEGLCSDRTIVTGPVKVVELQSGEVRELPVDDVGWLGWSDDETLLYAGWQGLGSRCGRIALDGSHTELWSGEATIGTRYVPRITVDAGGETVAAVRESAGEAPEVVLFENGSWRSISRLNDEVAGELELPRWERFAWTAHDGLELEGLLARPAGHEGGPLPLVVWVHGGPTASWTWQFAPQYGHSLLLASAGYAVLAPNPRGSAGRGAAFREAVLGDMGGEDFEDILAGVDASVAAGIADEDRVGIFGGSYGGFMSALAVTRSDRFAAAVPMAVVSNWLSFHFTTNIGRFDELFLDDDPYRAGGAYFERSPVAHAPGSRTPTLIVHGELDLCTPVGQARELYQALVDAGVETELAVYPREGHGYVERAHQIDVWQRMRAWFDRHLLREL